MGYSLSPTSAEDRDDEDAAALPSFDRLKSQSLIRENRGQRAGFLARSRCSTATRILAVLAPLIFDVSIQISLTSIPFEWRCRRTSSSVVLSSRQVTENCQKSRDLGATSCIVCSEECRFLRPLFSSNDFPFIPIVLKSLDSISKLPRWW